MQKYLLKNIQVVNEGRIEAGDVLISNGRIEKLGTGISANGAIEIRGEGRYLLPGLIDDQVHFREPGLTHKANIFTESRAAVAGGTTSFMEMPNTAPPALTEELLEHKYEIASRTSLANYSFYIGTSNDNADHVLKAAERKNEICGIKIFMGSSTGKMLVDNYLTLDRIFSEADMLIATHCEEESLILENYKRLKSIKEELQPSDHAVIRDEDVCYESSFKAVQLAKKYNTRLHILHISTAKELGLFTNMLPLTEKRITAEVCVHHLHFSRVDYAQHGNLIKCNPAIKAHPNRAALWEALLDDRLDVIATDHAPHTLEEKTGSYEQSHSGIPLVQHSLLLLLDHHKQGHISLEHIVKKTSHAVAECFGVAERGYIREGYYADLVIVDLGATTKVSKSNLLSKCAWSPFEGKEFGAAITHTFVNGHLAYANGTIDDSVLGSRLAFNR